MLAEASNLEMDHPACTGSTCRLWGLRWRSGQTATEAGFMMGLSQTFNGQNFTPLHQGTRDGMAVTCRGLQQFIVGKCK